MTFPCSLQVVLSTTNDGIKKNIIIYHLVHIYLPIITLLSTSFIIIPWAILLIYLILSNVCTYKHSVHMGQSFEITPIDLLYWPSILKRKKLVVYAYCLWNVDMHVHIYVIYISIFNNCKVGWTSVLLVQQHVTFCQEYKWSPPSMHEPKLNMWTLPAMRQPNSSFVTSI